MSIMQKNGKRLKTASSRTCETNIKKDIKALRPHVYITDSCSFKSLVQELTGNSNEPTSGLPPPCEALQRFRLEVTEENLGNGDLISVDTVIDPFDEEIMNDQAWINQDYHFYNYDDVFASMNQNKNFLTVVESWLLDLDHLS